MNQLQFPDHAPPSDSILDVGGLDAGAALLFIRNGVTRLEDGQVLEVASRRPEIEEEVLTWCRLNDVEPAGRIADPVMTRFFLRRRRGTFKGAPDWGMRLPERPKGSRDTRDWMIGRLGDVPVQAPPSLGFIPRGAVAEEGTPDFPYDLNLKVDVWADTISDLYEQAKSQQWNASTDIAWSELPSLPDDIERAVCQLMTFLAENEYSALYIPAKFIPRINAQYAEVILFLSTVINDEARHIEAFTKRALANGGGLQYAAALTEWSLHSLFVQDDYFSSGFLLHVLGEGTFLDLLDFIAANSPDPVTRDVVRRARMDEGRHVAYGIAHAREHLLQHPLKASQLADAAEERAAVLRATSGDNPMVVEALAVLAGGGSKPEQLEKGLSAVHRLYEIMDSNRQRRMLQIGLSPALAAKISSLHTPNFM